MTVICVGQGSSKGLKTTGVANRNFFRKAKHKSRAMHNTISLNLQREKSKYRILDELL